MSCEYCRGEKPLLDSMGDDGGWRGTINPSDGTMTARFEAGPLYGYACGELELDFNFCPMCGELICIPPYEEIEPSTEQLMREEWGV